MLPVDPQSASSLLQYGALGVVVIMLLLGAWFGQALMKMIPQAVDRLADRLHDAITRGFQSVIQDIKETRHDLRNTVTGSVLTSEGRLHDALEAAEVRLHDSIHQRIKKVDLDETPPRKRT
jgi:hypothetical protein